VKMIDFKLFVHLKEFDSAIGYELNNSYIVGRDSSCEIRIQNAVISKEHFTLILMPKAKCDEHFFYLIRDGTFTGLPSKNGTWINGIRSNEIVKLKHQDIITFGQNYPKAIFWESSLEYEHYGRETSSTERQQ